MVGAFGITGIPTIANACGVKLAVRAPDVPSRSAHPTRVHVVNLQDRGTLHRMLKRAGHSVIPTALDGVGADTKVVLTNGRELSAVKRQVGPSVIVIRAKRNDGQTFKELEEALAQRSRLPGA
jgi:anti-sigma factor ChrR (cupin superfamily)